jgi:hypothetical protein
MINTMDAEVIHEELKERFSKMFPNNPPKKSSEIRRKMLLELNDYFNGERIIRKGSFKTIEEVYNEFLSLYKLPIKLPKRTRELVAVRQFFFLYDKADI